MFYRKKDLLEKAATIKRFEYSPLNSEFKKQNYIEKKQYQGLDKLLTFDKEDYEAMKEPELKMYKESDLIYSNKHCMFLSCHVRGSE